MGVAAVVAVPLGVRDSRELVEFVGVAPAQPDQLGGRDRVGAVAGGVDVDMGAAAALLLAGVDPDGGARGAQIRPHVRAVLQWRGDDLPGDGRVQLDGPLLPASAGRAVVRNGTTQRGQPAAVQPRGDRFGGQAGAPAAPVLAVVPAVVVLAVIPTVVVLIVGELQLDAKGPACPNPYTASWASRGTGSAGCSVA